MSVDMKIWEVINQKKKQFQSPTLHTKYVDELTLLEAIKMKEDLIPNPDRPLPDSFHARLGLKLNKLSQKYTIK